MAEPIVTGAAGTAPVVKTDPTATPDGVPVTAPGKKRATARTSAAAKKAAAERAANREAAVVLAVEPPYEAPLQFVVVVREVALHFPQPPGEPVPDDDGEVVVKGDYIVPETARQFDHLRSLENLGLLKALPIT